MAGGRRRLVGRVYGGRDGRTLRVRVERRRAALAQDRPPQVARRVAGGASDIVSDLCIAEGALAKNGGGGAQ